MDARRRRPPSRRGRATRASAACRRAQAGDLDDPLRRAFDARAEPVGLGAHVARASGERQREPLRERGVDHESASTTIAASSSSPARVRAATTGERGSRSSGAASGLVGRERHEPAALAHDQLRGGGVDRAAAASA